MLDIDKKQELEKLNKLKEQDSLVCEIVIPKKESKKDIMSIIYGTGGYLEVAKLAQSLEDILENLKHNFPKIVPLISLLHQCSGMGESYKKIEQIEKIERKEKE